MPILASRLLTGLMPLVTLFLLALPGLMVARPGLAQSAERIPPGGVATVELLPGWSEGPTHVAALRIRLAPGWKTYWRAPGEAGIPPSIDWQGSGNLEAVQYVWPVPDVFVTNGMRAIGYDGELILPVILTPSRPGQPIRLEAGLDLGVCLEVCVPVSAEVRGEVGPGGRPDPVIRAALAARALTAAEAGVRRVSCRVEPIRDGLKVTASVEMPAQGGAEVVVIEAGVPGIWASEALSRRDGRTLTAEADLVPPQAKPFSLDRSRLRITVISPGRAVDILGCPGG